MALGKFKLSLKDYEMVSAVDILWEAHLVNLSKTSSDTSVCFCVVLQKPDLHIAGLMSFSAPLS